MPDGVHAQNVKNAPRSPARIVDINTASQDEISHLPMVGRDRAQALIRNRPFRNWEEIARLPGFGKGMLFYLKSGGAEIGSPED